MASTWRQQKKEELRRRLYDASIELFESQGYENTTVQAITDAVQVAKGTFFNHFPSKEHVVEAWYQQLTAQCLDAAWQRLEEPAVETVEESVCQLLRDMGRRAASQPQLMLAKARHNAHPLLMQAEQAQDDRLQGFLRHQLSLAKQRGEVAEDIDEAFFSELVVAMVTGSARAWVRTEGRFDLADLFDQRVRFLFRGARSGACSGARTEDR